MGVNTCSYARTTSTAVKISSATHTKKYGFLLSSCSTAAGLIAMWCIVLPRRNEMPLHDLGGHQIHQRENEHPHQVYEMPVQSRYLDVMSVIDLRLQE